MLALAPAIADTATVRWDVSAVSRSILPVASSVDALASSRLKPGKRKGVEIRKTAIARLFGIEGICFT
ncbi:MAG: hypothetical protein ACI9R3_001920 [Verrucomicrobiales bacterium]|jgi:hypothetical protein